MIHPSLPYFLQSEDGGGFSGVPYFEVRSTFLKRQHANQRNKRLKASEIVSHSVRVTKKTYLKCVVYRYPHLWQFCCKLRYNGKNMASVEA